MEVAMRIEFSVPGVPMAQPRGRPVRVGNGSMRVVVPQSNRVHSFKAAVQLAAVNAMDGRQPFDVPVEVFLWCWFPRPKSKTLKSRPNLPYPLTQKPDADNLAKSVLDACNQVLWVDDKLAWRVAVEKWVCGDSQVPHTEIELWANV